jgi:predicted MPP superfamily phosphohydrolase
MAVAVEIESDHVRVYVPAMAASSFRDRFNDYSARRRSQRALRESTKQRFGLRLRHFAGPVIHREQLGRPLRIAHLTDQHVGLVTPLKVQMAAVDIANREKPDLVVITGDFVCHSHAYLDQLTEVIASINAPAVGVLGNHDYWSGAKAVRKALRRGGLELLENANTVMTFGNERLQLVGLDDAYTGHADRAKAVKGLDPSIATLGLSHIAEEADGLWASGVPLVLSGHTHAGQLSVARLNELTLGKLMKHRFIHGLYGSRAPGEDTPKGAVYVGAGIGAAVMPIRIGDRANREVTIFDLGATAEEMDEHHTEQPVVPWADGYCEDTARKEANAQFHRRQQRKKKPPAR